MSPASTIVTPRLAVVLFLLLLRVLMLDGAVALGFGVFGGRNGLAASNTECSLVSRLVAHVADWRRSCGFRCVQSNNSNILDPRDDELGDDGSGVHDVVDAHAKIALPSRRQRRMQNRHRVEHVDETLRDFMMHARVGDFLANRAWVKRLGMLDARSDDVQRIQIRFVLQLEQNDVDDACRRTNKHVLRSIGRLRYRINRTHVVIVVVGSAANVAWLLMDLVVLVVVIIIIIILYHPLL